MLLTTRGRSLGWEEEVAWHLGRADAGEEEAAADPHEADEPNGNGSDPI